MVVLRRGKYTKMNQDEENNLSYLFYALNKVVSSYISHGNLSGFGKRREAERGKIFLLQIARIKSD